MSSQSAPSPFDRAFPGPPTVNPAWYFSNPNVDTGSAPPATKKKTARKPAQKKPGKKR